MPSTTPCSSVSARRSSVSIETDLDRQRFVVFRSLTLLRMMAIDPSLVDAEDYADVPSSKLEALFDRLEEVVGDGHRVLLFSQFTSYLDRVAAELSARGVGYAHLDGSTRDRDGAVSGFREGDAPVFLISLKAGGFGLTLTEADYVFLLDPWWNPAAEAQAVDRAHRIGQDRQVMVYRMVAEDTIEEKVLALQQRKAELFDAFTDGGEAFLLSRSRPTTSASCSADPVLPGERRGGVDADGQLEGGSVDPQRRRHGVQAQGARRRGHERDGAALPPAQQGAPEPRAACGRRRAG